MYRSFDPYHRRLLAEFPAVDGIDPQPLVQGFHSWKSFSVEERVAAFRDLAQRMTTSMQVLAEKITLEMGKPINESVFEIQKCISTIEHYCGVAPDLLKRKVVVSAAKESYLIPEPLGPILAIMPWNFPFWQVLRLAIPSMLAGNTMVLKHAPNVPQCAGLLEGLFATTGFPNGVFTNHYLTNEGVAAMIASHFIAGVAFTGSDATGSLIAALSGKHVKKSTLELGGNDPMIVFGDAPVEAAAAAALQSRCINAGQACNGAKRFLVEERVHDDFVRALSNKLSELRCGDPMDPVTQIGPIARLDLFEKVRRQVNGTIQQGASVFYQSTNIPEASWIYPPTLLTGVRPDMTAFNEEIFGPVWSVTTFRNREEALQLANASEYGLGASVWTNDDTIIDWIIPRLETGNVFVNDFVRSDARFPFGGVKRSGFGKELGEAGLFEFVNWKTVWKG